jgi:hypothetical protein
MYLFLFHFPCFGPMGLDENAFHGVLRFADSKNRPRFAETASLVRAYVFGFPHDLIRKVCNFLLSLTFGSGSCVRLTWNPVRVRLLARDRCSLAARGPLPSVSPTAASRMRRTGESLDLADAIPPRMIKAELTLG